MNENGVQQAYKTDRNSYKRHWIECSMILFVTGLLADNCRLGDEKRELARQFSRDRERLEERLRQQDVYIEEVTVTMEKTLEEKRVEIEDLHKQLEVTEKALKANKNFLEVSAA